MPVTGARPMNRETGKEYQEGAAPMPKWNFVAMGQVGLTGWTHRGTFVVKGQPRHIRY